MTSVAQWVAEISARKKAEKDFRKEGDRIIDIYSGKKKSTTPFNILFSNTETLLPALYSNTPRPVVARRFKDEDPVGKAAADAGERGLTFLLDTNVDGYETFDEAMRAATLDALLPGRGVTCLKYDAELGELPTQSVDDEVPAEDAEPAEEPTPYKKSELVCCDARSWNRVYFGYAKKWSKVPWIAYEENVDREEATRLFGAEMAGKLVYTTAKEDDEDKKKEDDEAKGETRTALIYQIWDKDGGRKIRYVSPNYLDAFLLVEDDPLGLSGFFNCPKPLQLIEKSNDLMPVAPYVLYENQAKELNKLTIRINRIIEAMKARGIYDSALGEDIGNLMEADDNMLVPADKAASLAEGGIMNAIWFMPVEKLIQVLQQLYVARESCKAVIFEIMGLADIMRGASQASETLGAQEIKQAWGGLRLKRTQKEVQRYARDLLRLTLEIAAAKFSEETWVRMTGLPYLTEAKVMELQGILQAAQQAMADPQQAQQAQQAMQQAQQQLQTPKWSDVLATLRDDIQRSYRIDIETNSTVEPEAVEDQKNIAEVMNALGQFLNGVTPLVVNGSMPFQAAQSMMLAIVRRFRFGDEIEEYIRQMKQPQSPDAGKQEAEKAKQAAETQRMQMENQAKGQELQQKQAEAATKGQIAERQAALEMQRMDREAEYAAQEHAFKLEELAAKRSLAQFVATSKMAVAEQMARLKSQQAAEKT